MLFLCCGYFIPKIPLSDLFCIPIFLFPRLFRFPCKPGIPICFLVSYCSPKLWFWRFSRIRTSESDIRLKAWLWDFASGAYRHLWDPDVALCVKIYTVVFSIFPFGLVMPIFGPWDSVELWVRWRPYNIQAELLWRGTFATFFLAFFLAAANPKVCNSIVAFFAWHGICHSISMFVDNRILPADGNDNLEHLLEISVFMVLGLTNCLVGTKVWF
ncbi:unnamed protein product [Symbiodinium microadriaticum]|nr:unnamed protein product [Symbiodinium microadriaticum]